jgi:hypothetical protein
MTALGSGLTQTEPGCGMTSPAQPYTDARSTKPPPAKKDVAAG